MVEKFITSASPSNVVDFASYQRGRNAAGKAPAMSARICRHCGAALAEGEHEDECSSAFNVEAPALAGRASLRGVNGWRSSWAERGDQHPPRRD